MAKTKTTAGNTQTDTASLRERVEMALFIAVEVLCLVLFLDFLFFGFYIK